MGSSGKKKTTMAKLAREKRLRERRLNKQAKRDARRQASDPDDEQASAPGHGDEAVRASRQVDAEPTDRYTKEVALRRLRDAPDEELAIFEDKLRDDALETGAAEREMRAAQRNHPGHGA